MMNSKSQFSFFTQGNFSIWLIVLLLIQIILSVLIVRRLNDLKLNLEFKDPSGIPGVRLLVGD
jgi:hypothetical protein